MTAIPAPLVLPDPRRARGKHRAPRLSVLADRAYLAWRGARVEAAIVAAGVGAVLASVLS